MKVPANRFALLLLLLWVAAVRSQEDQPEQLAFTPPPEPNINSVKLSSPFISSIDALAQTPPATPTPADPSQPPPALDSELEQEARGASHLLDSREFQDPHKAIESIDNRRAAVPPEPKSMEGIFKDIVQHLRMINCQHPPSNNRQADRTFIESLLSRKPDPVESQYSLCDEDLAPVVFMPLADPTTTKATLYSHFRENIYNPLGYEIPSDRFSYADTISDLINLDPDNSVIHRNMHGLNFGNFSSVIEKAFESVETAATDFDQNKSLISRQMIDILKSFHIFWNVLRQKKQVGMSKVQTVAIIRQLIQRFRATNAGMKAATLNILENIKEAYFRFMRAHKYQKLISAKPLETIAFQMLERFKANVVKIRERQTNTFTFVSEMSAFLDMLKGFHQVNKMRGMTPPESLMLYETMVAQPITNTYNVFQDVMVQNHDSSFYRVREFTATLLLKMKHRNHVIVNFFGWTEYFRSHSATDSRLFDNVVKFYEEIVDAVMLIPSSCGEYRGSSLEACLKDKLESALAEYSKKYMLEASVSGISLYRYVQQVFDKVSADIIAAGDAEDLNAFKGVFVTKMSALFKQFRLDYHINDMSEVEELENNVGFQIEKVKAASALSAPNLALIDAFDKTLYAFFLDIKSSYNAYAPVGKDQRVINSISQKLSAAVSNFKIDHARQVNPETVRLMETVLTEARLWARRHSVQYVVNTHPVNLRFEPVNPMSDMSLHVPNVGDIQANVPMLDASVMGNMGQQAASFAEEMDGQSLTRKRRQRLV